MLGKLLMKFDDAPSRMAWHGMVKAKSAYSKLRWVVFWYKRQRLWLFSFRDKMTVFDVARKTQNTHYMIHTNHIRTEHRHSLCLFSVFIYVTSVNNWFAGVWHARLLDLLAGEIEHVFRRWMRKLNLELTLSPFPYTSSRQCQPVSVPGITSDHSHWWTTTTTTTFKKKTNCDRTLRIRTTTLPRCLFMCARSKKRPKPTTINYTNFNDDSSLQHNNYYFIEWVANSIDFL